MNIRYDNEVDTLYIRLTDASIEESAEVEPGVIVDMDTDGMPTGIEVLDASLRFDIARNAPQDSATYQRFVEETNRKARALVGK